MYCGICRSNITIDAVNLTLLASGIGNSTISYICVCIEATNVGIDSIDLITLDCVASINISLHCSIGSNDGRVGRSHIGIDTINLSLLTCRIGDSTISYIGVCVETANVGIGGIDLIALYGVGSNNGRVRTIYLTLQEVVLVC